MKQKLIYLMIAALTLIAPSSTNAEVITQSDVPLYAVVSFACAVSGQSEMVALSGEVHAVFSVTTDATGGLHIDTHFNNADVSGMDLTTGNNYRASGANRFSWNATGLMSEFTFINNFQLIGSGPGNNLVVHETVHTTVNANGDVTAAIENIAVDCK